MGQKTTHFTSMSSILLMEEVSKLNSLHLQKEAGVSEVSRKNKKEGCYHHR